MNRFQSLIKEFETLYPDGWWIKSNQQRNEVDGYDIHLPSFVIYEQALDILSEKSWVSLKAKIEKLFKSNSRGRGKQPFFNEFNEALAYEYLKKRGCYDLSFPLEGKVKGLKIPDLEFKENGNFGMCEVKTISVSDVEKNASLRVRYILVRFILVWI